MASVHNNNDSSRSSSSIIIVIIIIIIIMLLLSNERIVTMWYGTRLMFGSSRIDPSRFLYLSVGVVVFVGIFLIFFFN